MKFLLISLILAVTAHNALGYRRSYSPHDRLTGVNMKRLMYAAGGAAQCDICEMVVGDIQSLLKGQEPEIENLLDSLCQDLPVRYRANCTNIIDTYLPVVFTLIDDMTPEEVCELLTLCTGETEMPEVSGRGSLTAVFNHYISRVSRMRSLKERRINYIRGQLGEDYLCEACEDAVGYVHDAVACNQTWGEIARFLSPLCELCPSEYRSQCLNFFQELPGDVNEFADEYLDPETDCEIFGFCPSDEPTEEEPTEAPEVVEPEVAVGQVPIEVRSQRIVVEMDNPRINDMSRFSKKKFGKGGKKVSKNMKNMGIRGMDRTRRPRSIIVQVAGETENQIPYDVYDTEGHRYETVPAEKKCAVCRYFSSAAEGVLEYNEEDITNGITTVFADICAALPQQFRDECSSEIEDVLPGVIYQMLLKVMNPDYLCTEMIGICQ